MTPATAPPSVALLDNRSRCEVPATDVRLITLGGLEITPHPFGKRQAMLLLAYLALEGPTERSRLAELFWSGAKNPLNNLSSSLTRLRSIDPAMVDGDRFLVRADVATDIHELRRLRHRGQLDAALGRYRGRFLDGFDLGRLHPELQEWVLDQRNTLAVEARDIALDLALELNRAQRAPEAGVLAERAWRIAADGLLDAGFLQDLYPLLGDNRAVAAEVAATAAELDVVIGPDHHRARTSSNGQEPATPSEIFLGRTAELTVIRERLRPNHPVAVVGLGGAGKTTLATEAVKQIDGELGPAYLIDATACPTVDRLVAAIGQQLLGDGADTDVHALAEDVGSLQALVVIDSAEHLASELRALDPLAASCPNLSLLVTSRVAVPLTNITEVPLCGLTVDSEPSCESDGSFSESRFSQSRISESRISESTVPDGIRLFEIWYQRRTARPGTPPPDRVVVADICRLVDGLPLGIILATSWSGTLSVEEILLELQTGAATLDDPDRAPAPHHGDISHILATSWQLLAPADRTALDRLCLFPAGFNRAAAEKVGGCSLSGLRRLTDHSLVARTDDGGFRCHPLVRAHGRQRLSDDDRTEGERERAELLMDALADVPVEAIGSNEVDLPFEDPVTNIIEIWTRARITGNTMLLDRLVDPYCRLLSRSGLTGEAERELAATIADLPPVSADDGGAGAARAQLLMQHAWLELFLGHTASAEQLARSGLALATADDHELLVELHRVLAGAARARGDIDEALDLLRRARATVHGVPARTVALLDEHIAMCMMAGGQHDTAIIHYEDVLSWADDVGHHRTAARVRHSLAIAHHEIGDPQTALEFALLARDEAEQAELADLLPYITSRLAQVRLAVGDHDGAAAALDSALEQLPFAREPWFAIELQLISARLRFLENDRAALLRQLEQAIAQALAADDLPFVAKALLLAAEVDELVDGADEPEGAEQAEYTPAILATLAEGTGVDGYDRRTAIALAADRGLDLNGIPVTPLVELAPVVQRRLRLARLDDRSR